MGFPSPAQDYVESRIDLNVICQVRPSVTMFDIDGVLHLMDSGSKPMSGGYALFRAVRREGGRQADVGQSIITRDGETLEGFLWRIS
jgi:DNA polymerase V